MSPNKNDLSMGHRERLRKRYEETGINSLSEHEILELLLFYSIPRKDTKEISKKLINSMGGFSQVFDADIENLINKGKISYNSAVLIKLINDINKKYEERKFEKGFKIASTDNANEFIRSIIKYEKVENLIVLCLNNERVVLGYEIIAKGDVNEVVVYTRKILEIALRFNAVSIVLGHNHPSGNPKPSESDLFMTNNVNKALSYSGINLFDHIIVGGKREEYYSFFANKKLKEK